MFEAPRRPALPAAGPKNSTNAIDRFVLEQLRQRGLSPSPRADKLRLLRRVTFDLTGLPPTLAEQEAIAQAALQAQGVVAQALHASEARFRAVFEGAAIGIGMADLDVRHADLGQLCPRHLTGERARVLDSEVLCPYLETRRPGRCESGRDRHERGKHDQLGRSRCDVGMSRRQRGQRRAVLPRAPMPEVHLQADRDGGHLRRRSPRTPRCRCCRVAPCLR